MWNQIKNIFRKQTETPTDCYNDVNKEKNNSPTDLSQVQNDPHTIENRQTLTIEDLNHDNKERPDKGPNQAPSCNNPQKYRLPYSSYTLPDIQLFPCNGILRPDTNDLKHISERLEWVLNGYGIGCNVINITSGPRCSLYEVQVEPRKLSQLARKEKDILTALGNSGCRIINPLPNKLTIGVEIPHQIDEVNIAPGDIFNSTNYYNSDMVLPIAIGIDSENNVVCEDLTKLGHLLICGGWDQGKTTLIYQIIASLLFKVSPDNLKFIIAHSNQLELQELTKLPKDFFAHIDDADVLISERTDLHRIFLCLMSEMDPRSKLLQLAGVRSIEEYNTLYVNRSLNPAVGHHYLPRIVCIVDEIQPFFNGKEWDDTLSPMFEMTKGVGIHFIFTTRYTSANSLTPLIRRYMPNKICFKINLSNESRLAIGSTDAVNLLDKGDILLVKSDKIIRCQTSDFKAGHLMKLINEITFKPLIGDDYILPEIESFGEADQTVQPVSDIDPLFEDVARNVVASGSASTSSIQRRYAIGYSRAGKIIDQLEAFGIISPAIDGKPRKVLVDTATLESILNF